MDRPTPSWIAWLEARFATWSVPDLAVFIVGMNAAVYVLSMLKPEFPLMLALDPGLILQGQVWRVVTFLFIPPAMGPLWMLFWLYMLFLVARALEGEWGEFRFNLYYAVGATATVGAALLLGRGITNVVLNTSLFLAFAALYPEFELLLFFFLPVKVKWLAWLSWAGIAAGFALGSWDQRAALVSGLLNYGLFFGPSHWSGFRRWRQERRNRRRYGKAFDGDHR